MNCEYLKKLAKTNPALARALELGVYSLVAYLFSIISTGEPFTTQAVFNAFFIPIMAYVSKRSRDIQKTQ